MPTEESLDEASEGCIICNIISTDGRQKIRVSYFEAGDKIV